MNYSKIIGITLALLLQACGSLPTLPDDYAFGPAPDNHEEKIKSHFNLVLKDPASADYRIGAPYQAYQQEGIFAGGGIQWADYAVDVYINAKNSFGGYTGFTPYLVYFSNGNVNIHCKKRTSINESRKVADRWSLLAGIDGE